MLPHILSDKQLTAWIRWNSEESETGKNLWEQDQGYMVNALTFPNPTISIFAEWLQRLDYSERSWSTMQEIVLRNKINKIARTRWPRNRAMPRPLSRSSPATWDIYTRVDLNYRKLTCVCSAQFIVVAQVAISKLRAEGGMGKSKMYARNNHSDLAHTTDIEHLCK
ncbi:hypothetical protein EVAR_14301_1 [Eumeta japonica]|uniref:Uncharacterized protein n=1 Tax=Eumeta variegata TaxID=151549 RepID=A0A4C1UMS7_EUMVA|nr:hypothetical protein EVAR_14301_1 [Eumeta japonica]